MSLSRRFFTRLFALCAIAAFAASYVPAPAAAQPGREVAVIRVPQFVAHAIKLQVVDETGWWDWTGSDEVRAVFVDFNANRERATSLYEETDTGDTVEFRDQDRCIGPQPNCNQGARSLNFGVALWEDDWSPSDIFVGCRPTALGMHPWYDDGVCTGDDRIGSAQISLSQLQLTGALPTVGHTIERMVPLTGGDGQYQFHYRITRLPDVERPIIIHEPQG